ncbi:MAG: asparagine synthase (glutamine-hydrolyzing) [Alphaproteobacteria bacterium]|nr:asparagine synthase (glutamine-hydrolyzing) [Alphaproteobacteria bacterium]
MCGFVGFVAGSGFADADALERATETIRHRGPDDGGIWLAEGGRAGFGFRRLSILDLSANGHQPMVSSDGRMVIVFNGEIYNFRDLRDELDREQPHAWRGHSDTEVVLELIRRHGVDAALERIDGMFAFALWDTRDDSLTLARDRFGEKPLYYGRSEGAFVFGSELKALRALPGFRDDLDQTALALFFRYRYVPGERSIYAHYHKLPAGGVLRLKGQDVQVRRYWDPQAEARAAMGRPFAGTFDDALIEAERLLTASVARRLESDVALGAFLSGGIDSSLTVALAQKASGRAVNTFTVGFAEQHFNEAPFARQVADHLGANHTEMIVSERDALAVVKRLPSMYDEPFADPSQLPTALLCAKAREHVTVAIAGDGGDELFCGYGRYDREIRRWASVGGRSGALRRALGGLAGVLPVDALDALDGLRGKPGKLGRKMLARLLDGSSGRAEEFFQFASGYWRDGVPVKGVGRLERELFVPPALDLPGAPDVKRFQVLDAMLYLPDDILVKVDRASMAASLEVRTPFLNADLARFAWSLPIALYDPAQHGLKIVLRKLLARHVPAELFERPKMGFDVPVRQWLRGDLKAWGDELVFGDNPLADQWLERQRIAKRWTDHQKGASLEGDLWPALMMLAWMRAR